MGLRGKKPRPITWEVTAQGCHVCTSHYTAENGYPFIRVDGRASTVIRHLYERAFGPIPPGMVVRHRCDNRRCINLEHVLLGTQLDNSRDCVERGRRPRGEGNGNARLTEDIVRAIRAAPESDRELAGRYGVVPRTITFIRRGETWKHVV